MIVVQAETQQNQLVEVEPHTITQRLSAYGALLKDGNILVVKTHSDNWEIPGGTPERGETLKEGLKRELKEEVGINVSVGRMFYMRESFYHTPSGKAYHSIQFYFLVTADGSPVAAEAKEHDFVPMKDVTADNTNKSSYLAVQHISDETLQYDVLMP